MIGSHRYKHNSKKTINIQNSKYLSKITVDSRSKYPSKIQFETEKIKKSNDSSKSNKLFSWFSKSKPTDFDEEQMNDFDHQFNSINKYENDICPYEIAIKELSRNNNKINIHFKYFQDLKRRFCFAGFVGRQGDWIDRLGFLIKEYNSINLKHRKENVDKCICHLRTEKILKLSHKNISSSAGLVSKQFEDSKLISFQLLKNKVNVKGFSFLFKSINYPYNSHIVKSDNFDKCFNDDSLILTNETYDSSRYHYFQMHYNDKMELAFIFFTENNNLIKVQSIKKKLSLKNQENFADYIDDMKINQIYDKTKKVVYFSKNNIFTGLNFSITSKGNLGLLSFAYKSF